MKFVTVLASKVMKLLSLSCVDKCVSGLGLFRWVGDFWGGDQCKRNGRKEMKWNERWDYIIWCLFLLLSEYDTATVYRIAW